MYAGCRLGLRVTVPNTTRVWGLSAMPFHQSGARLFFILGVDKTEPAPAAHPPTVGEKYFGYFLVFV